MLDTAPDIDPDIDPRSPIVVCAADNNYAMQLAVMARSAIDQLERDRNLRLFIIDGGITEQNKAKIVRSLDLNRCSLTWLQVAPEAQIKGPTLKHVTAAAYLRLLIPELLPDSIHKAIYLDSDLIVHVNLGQIVGYTDRRLSAAGCARLYNPLRFLRERTGKLSGDWAVARLSIFQFRGTGFQSQRLAIAAAQAGNDCLHRAVRALVSCLRSRSSQCCAGKSMAGA